VAGASAGIGGTVAGTGVVVLVVVLVLVVLVVLVVVVLVLVVLVVVVLVLVGGAVVVVTSTVAIVAGSVLSIESEVEQAAMTMIAATEATGRSWRTTARPYPPAEPAGVQPGPDRPCRHPAVVPARWDTRARSTVGE
jgi:hypothetical protein